MRIKRLNCALTNCVLVFFYKAKNESVPFFRQIRKEIKDGRENSLKIIDNLKPLVVCFNGKGISYVFNYFLREIIAFFYSFPTSTT